MLLYFEERDEMLKIRRNNDARSANRGASFASARAGTYTILRDEVAIGTIEKGIMHLSRINPNWCGTGEVWQAWIDGDLVAVDQKLATVKNALKAL